MNELIPALFYRSKVVKKNDTVKLKAKANFKEKMQKIKAIISNCLYIYL